MKTKQIKDSLPDKPSDLIELALRDVEAAEKTPGYKVQMEDIWHEKQNDTCLVCMAGAVASFSLDTDPDKKIEPDDFRKSISQKLYALNELRTGDIDSAAYDWPVLMTKSNISACLPNRSICPYEVNRKQFFKDMRELAADLRDIGK